MVMNKTKTSNLYTLSSVALVVCFLALPLIQGCTTASSSVIAATGTTIGVELSQNQTTQTPTGVLGYKRAELAYVPTNRGNAGKTTTSQDSAGKPIVTCENGLPQTGTGAKDSANVLMELRYSGIFDWGSGSGIYQRLAVGDQAVSQPGASLMFTKDSAGKVDQNAEKALSAAQQNLYAQVNPIDWQKALLHAREMAAERRPKIDIIVNKVRSEADKSLIDSNKLNALASKARLDKNDEIVRELLKKTNADELRYVLDEPGQNFVDKLLEAAVAP